MFTVFCGNILMSGGFFLLLEYQMLCFKDNFELSNYFDVSIHWKVRVTYYSLVATPEESAKPRSTKLRKARGDYINIKINIVFIHSSVICQSTGPQTLPKRFLYLMRSRASSFKWEYPLLSPRSSSNFLRLLPRLLFTSICPFIFPSITCFRRRFLRKIWRIQLAFRFSETTSL
jgi:hypothetical protein